MIIFILSLLSARLRVSHAGEKPGLSRTHSLCENKSLSIIFRHWKEEVNRSRRNCPNEELRSLHCSPDIKLLRRKNDKEGWQAWRGDKNALEIYTEKNEKRFWELKHKWECNMKRDLRQQEWEVANWMRCLHDKASDRTL